MNTHFKFDRKNLKQPDEFVSLASHFIGALIRFKKVLYATLGAVLVIFVGIYFYSNKKEKDLEASSYLFSEAFKVFDARVEDDETATSTDAESENESELKYPSKEAKFQTALTKFEELNKKYAKYPYGQIALFYLGHANYQLGNYEAALTYYQQFEKGYKGPKDVENLIFDTLGHTYEEKGDLENALTFYEKITGSEESFLKDYAYYNIGRIYELKNDIGNAKANYKKVKAEFPDSNIVSMADQRMALLVE